MIINMSTPQQLRRIRRLALEAQGLLTGKGFARGVAGARDAIKHLGYVQIDTISVVERAHHHVIYTRVPSFKPAMVNQLLRTREVFEYWSHAAALLPIEDFRFSLPYKHAIKNGKTHWYKNPDKKLMQRLLERIRAEGPLRSRDMEAAKKGSAGWGNGKPAKKALEQLYMEGHLMICDREGFEKIYDLTERVLPSGVNTLAPTTAEFAEHLVQQQLRCHGLVNLKGITYLRRDPVLRRAVEGILAEQKAQGLLVELCLPSGEVYLLRAELLQKPLPQARRCLQILSPFDNSVIQRDRLRALFQYDYQIECYVPEKKRRFGYFCLPLLFADQFIGRMDCKVHRPQRQLEIKSLHLETQVHNREEVIVALARALEKFRHFQGCDTIVLGAGMPKVVCRGLLTHLSCGLVE